MRVRPNPNLSLDLTSGSRVSLERGDTTPVIQFGARLGNEKISLYGRGTWLVPHEAEVIVGIEVEW